MKNVTVARVLLAVGVLLLLGAWWIATGHDLFESTNAGAFGYAGLTLAFASFLVPA